MVLGVTNDPGNNITHRYVLHLASAGLASLMTYFSFKCARAPATLINTALSSQTPSRSKLVLTRSRPRDFDPETIVGKVEHKAAWFWSQMAKVIMVSIWCNSVDGCGPEEWGGKVSWIIWRLTMIRAMGSGPC